MKKRFAFVEGSDDDKSLRSTALVYELNPADGYQVEKQSKVKTVVCPICNKRFILRTGEWAYYRRWEDRIFYLCYGCRGKKTRFIGIEKGE